MVLVLRPGALGDTLLALPAVRALRQHLGEVTLAAHAGAARLLAELGEVEHGLAFDDPSLAWIFRGQAARQPVIAWMSAPLPGALVLAPGRPSTLEHCADYLLRTLEPLGIAGPRLDAPLRVAPFDSDEVLVHPGSGSAAKNWPAERFAAAINALEMPVRLLVGEADERAAEEVERRLGRAVPRLEQPLLPELAARLAGCRAYLGNDSGVSHLAGLCGARSVVLFGPTDPRVWRPLGPRVIVRAFSTPPEQVARLLLG